MPKKRRLFEVEVVGADKVSRRLQRPVTKPAEPHLSAATKKLAKAVRDEAPKRSGKLRRGHVARKVGKMTYVVTDKEPYGGIVRQGSPRHDIYPRKKQALWWPGLARPVRYVNHPGFKANPYHDRALRKAQGPIDKELGLLAGAVVREWER